MNRLIAGVVLGAALATTGCGSDPAPQPVNTPQQQPQPQPPADKGGKTAPEPM